MPEGPIIIILKEAVESFKGKTVVQATGTATDIDYKSLSGQTITGFKSWGKNLIICFPRFAVRIHLMMFGSYRINEHRGKPPRLGLQFEDGSELNFYTCVVQQLDQPLEELYDWTADVMNPNWDAKQALAKLKENPETLVCDALMDQQIFAGVGNIIKNEVLFRVKVHPLSRVGDMPPAQLNNLITEAVNYSFDFLKWKKELTLKKHWQAYNQKTCPRNRIPFHKQYLGKTKRQTFYCEACQVLY